MNKSFRLEDRWFDNATDLFGNFSYEKAKKYEVLDVVSSFDIETTSFYVSDGKGGQAKQGCMYCWVFGMNGRCTRGRTWSEFLTLLHRIKEEYGIDLKHRLIIYVHNLSFEFQWFRHYFEWSEVFSVEERKPVHALTKDGFWFKCSYLLTDMSLDILSRNLTKYKVRKLVGDLDYDLPRTSDTPLTDTEWEYVLHDGLVVMAYIQEEVERLGSLTAIPNTKTGYVRGLCRDHCLGGSGRSAYYRLMKGLALTEDDYKMAKWAFTGGFTHANHNNVGKVCRDVSSYDFTSSYPAVMLSEKFPMSSPKEVIVHTKQEFDRYISAYSCLFTAEFTNLRAKFDFEHYISRSRCSKIEHYFLDNGRVVNASLLVTTITEQDYLIIKECYKWDSIRIGGFRIMYRDYLPKPFIDTILSLYEKKTTLKNVQGKEAEYMVSKAMLNSCYGMCVTDICRPKAEYQGGQWNTEKPDLATELSSYNKARGRFLYYLWGVWVTAYARRNLWSAILECRNDYIYADTDSVKIFSQSRHKDYFDGYNRMIQEKIKTCLKARDLDWHRASPKTIKGVSKPLGVWDYEGDYLRFKTLGAKRYLYEDSSHQIHITISGVGKKAGAEYLWWKCFTNDRIFQAFTDKLVFPATYCGRKKGSGKLLHTYLDEPMSGSLTDYLGHTGTYSELSGVHLEPTSYDMSIDDNFFLYIFGRDSDNIII